MSQFRKSLTGALLFSTFAAGFSGGAAVAQTTVADTTSDDIVITAERRTESLQKVPISATVFNADMLADRGIDNIDDVQQAAPSVAINTYNRSTFINIRGVGIAQSAPTSNPGVAYYIDGVFFPHEQFIAPVVLRFRLDRSAARPARHAYRPELHRRRHLCATPAPQFDGVARAIVDQTVGDYDGIARSAAVNVPLGEKSAMRVSAVYDVRGSFTKNIGPSR